LAHSFLALPKPNLRTYLTCKQYKTNLQIPLASVPSHEKSSQNTTIR
jgi:hypothetical protein